MQKFLVGILFILVSVSGFGQSRQITGTVVDNKNEPLVAASIVEVGHNENGSFTDGQGKFDITITDSKDAKIEISYIGYITQIISITNINSYQVVLQSEAVSIQSVVITVPYGKQKKETFTGSLSALGSDKIGQTTETSFDKALQGQVPGIVLSTASGQPGATSQIQLRGAGSISAGSEPLIVLDGVPMFSGQTTQYSTNTSILASINPNDIENISVLKDASATSLYGSRASNGVIMITTKQGKKGVTQYSFSTSQGVGQIVTNNFALLDAEGYKELQSEAMRNAGDSEEEIAKFLKGATGNVNWFDEVYRPAWNQNYEFAAQGGDDKNTFYLSTNYKDEQGIVNGTDMQRFSARLNITNKANKNCTFGVKFNPSFTTQHLTEAPGVLASPVTSSFVAAPTTEIKINDEYNFSNMFYNPVGIIELNKNYNKANRMLGNAFLQYKITPHLEFSTINNVDYIDTKEYIYRHPLTPEGKLKNGIAEAYFTDITTITSSNTLHWNKTIATDHVLDFIVGGEAESSTTNLADMKASNFPVTDVESISSAASMDGMNSNTYAHTLLSGLSNLQYNYKSTYFLSASYRLDGSSKFSPNNRWGAFWSVGGSWMLSNEEFIKSISAISLLKLRASYGTSGNADIDNYLYMQLYGFGQNYNGEPGATPKQMGNGDLTWEKNKNMNIGIDATIYKRFDASVDVYKRNTYDLLLNIPVDPLTGYTNQYQNVGAMTNKGIELSITARVIEETDFSWTSSVTFAKNINTITALDTTIIQGTKIRKVGESLQTFYLREWAGVNSADGSPMWYDSNGNLTKDYNQARQVIAGSADPKFTAGWNNTVTYKQFSLGFLWYLNYGNLVYNQLNMELQSDGALSGKNQLASSLDYWKEPGDISDNPKLIQGNGTNSNEFSTRYLEDGSYIRLKNVQLTYTIPTPKLEKYKISNCSIFMQGQNLWVWSRFTGLDPETRSSGVYYFDYPKQRLVSMGISVKF